MNHEMRKWAESQKLPKPPEWIPLARALRAPPFNMSTRQTGKALGLSDAYVSAMTSENFVNYLFAYRYKSGKGKGKKFSIKDFGFTPDEQEELYMADRKYELQRDYSDKSNPKNMVTITCHEAGCSNTASFSKHGSISPVHASKYFRGLGWAVGNHPKGDRCPECLKKFHSSIVNKVKEKVVEAAPVQNVVSGELTREYRRIIHNKLEDTYIDEKVGYSADWDDTKVAADLGVPVEWVSEIRDQNFGPQITKDDKKKHVDEVKAVAAHVKELIVGLEAKLAEFDKRAAELTVEYKKLSEEYRSLSSYVSTINPMHEQLGASIKHFEALVKKFLE